MRLPIKSKEQHIETLVINKQEYISFTGERVNIVLTPAYYWFKREILPVQSVAQAKKLVGSIFDGMVPDGEYSYHVVKKDNAFLLFAYSDALIVSRLTQLGLKPSQIAQIYFAQTECEELETPLQLNDGNALVVQDGTVSLVPVVYLTDTMPVESFFSGHRFTKHTVSVSFFQNSFLEEKYLYRMMVVSVAFILLYFGEYLMLRQELKSALGQQMAITEHFHLPQTSFELNGLKNALNAKEARQLELRQKIKEILAFKFNDGEYLKKIVVGQKTGIFEIALASSQGAEIIKEQLQKQFKITSVKVVDMTFYVGVSL